MNSYGMPEFEEVPDWKPLEQVLPPEHCADFMHMGHIGTIQMYKHRNTRRYLHIDAVSGAFFAFRDGEYHGITEAEALVSVLR